MKIRQLRSRLGEIHAQADTIVRMAEREKRSLTEMESAKVNELTREFKSIEASIGVEEASAVVNASQGRIVAPYTPGASPFNPTNTSRPGSSEEGQSFAVWAMTGRGLATSTRNASSMTIAGGTDDGAATVPTIVSNQLREIQADQGAIRRLANVMGVGQPVELPIATSLPGAEWRTETDTRQDQTVPVVKRATLPGGHLSSIIPISTDLLNDSAWNMEAYIISAIGRAIGLTEAAGFLSGTGADGQVKGILSHTLAATADSSRAYGTLEKLHTGSSGAGLTPDFLMALSVKLNPAYRKNASYVMHPATYSSLLQTKAATSGNYLLNASASGTGLPSIWGLPVHLDVNVPVIAADAAAVLCGDFRAGYTIEDIGAMKVVRDPYTAKGFVKVWVETRLLAGVVDSNAIKVGVASA